ncbi:MAG: response regulator [Deltaproteobacteria bacterium]|nr:response regulator [Deltaproteobacteria bacterium]
MSEGLDLIIVDDDPEVCEMITETIERFYAWGDVIAFTNAGEATDYCLAHETGVAIFVLDVFLENETAFTFLDSISDKFSMAYEDSIIITGNASDDVVNVCVASDITHLLEKPVRSYALQLAVRAIVSKYMTFAKKLMAEPALAERIRRL